MCKSKLKVGSLSGSMELCKFGYGHCHTYYVHPAPSQTFIFPINAYKCVIYILASAQDRQDMDEMQRRKQRGRIITPRCRLFCITKIQTLLICERESPLVYDDNGLNSAFVHSTYVLKKGRQIKRQSKRGRFNQNLVRCEKIPG